MAGSTTIILVVILIGQLYRNSAATRGISRFAVVGENVTVPCSPEPSKYLPQLLSDYDCQNYLLSWEHTEADGSSNTPISNCLTIVPFTDSRYTVDYNYNSYNLHISRIQESDAGRYDCTTRLPRSGFTDVLELIFTVAVAQPSCSATPNNAQIGDDVSLICSLHGGEALLQWMTSGGIFVGQPRTTRRFKSLVYNVTVTEENNVESFTCVSVYPSGEYFPHCSAMQVAQKVTIPPSVSNQGTIGERGVEVTSQEAIINVVPSTVSNQGTIGVSMISDL